MFAVALSQSSAETTASYVYAPFESCRHFRWNSFLLRRRTGTDQERSVVARAGASVSLRRRAPPCRRSCWRRPAGPACPPLHRPCGAAASGRGWDCGSESCPRSPLRPAAAWSACHSCRLRSRRCRHPQQWPACCAARGTPGSCCATPSRHSSGPVLLRDDDRWSGHQRCFPQCRTLRRPCFCWHQLAPSWEYAEGTAYASRQPRSHCRLHRWMRRRFPSSVRSRSLRGASPRAAAKPPSAPLSPALPPSPVPPQPQLAAASPLLSPPAPTSVDLSRRWRASLQLGQCGSAVWETPVPHRQ